KVRWLHGEAGGENLCLAGGVALNCVANGRILREGPFRRLFVQPAAGDSGGCLGAAALAHRQLAGRRPAGEALARVDLGPGIENAEIERILEAAGVPASDFREREPELVDAVAARIARGEVIGWVQGRMEHGPRALGKRSTLASRRSSPRSSAGPAARSWSTLRSTSRASRSSQPPRTRSSRRRTPGSTLSCSKIS